MLSEQDQKLSAMILKGARLSIEQLRVCQELVEQGRVPDVAAALRTNGWIKEEELCGLLVESQACSYPSVSPTTVSESTVRSDRRSPPPPQPRGSEYLLKFPAHRIAVETDHELNPNPVGSATTTVDGIITPHPQHDHYVMRFREHRTARERARAYDALKSYLWAIDVGRHGSRHTPDITARALTEDVALSIASALLAREGATQDDMRGLAVESDRSLCAESAGAGAACEYIEPVKRTIVIGAQDSVWFEYDRDSQHDMRCFMEDREELVVQQLDPHDDWQKYGPRGRGRVEAWARDRESRALRNALGDADQRATGEVFSASSLLSEFDD